MKLIFVFLLLFSLPSLAFNPFTHYSMDIDPAPADFWECKFKNSTMFIIYFRIPLLSELPSGTWNCSNNIFSVESDLPIVGETRGNCNVSDIMNRLEVLTDDGPYSCDYFINYKKTLLAEKSEWHNYSIVDSFSVWKTRIYKLNDSLFSFDGSGGYVLNDSGIYLYILSADPDEALGIACNVAGCYSLLGWYALILIAFIALAIFLFRHNHARLHRIR